MSNADDWKSNGRPTSWVSLGLNFDLHLLINCISTIARNFSASLNDAFAIDSSLEGLAQSVEQKSVDFLPSVIFLLKTQSFEFDLTIKKETSCHLTKPGA